jgi:hypothetical protein
MRGVPGSFANGCDLALHLSNDLRTAFAYVENAGDDGYIGIDICERFWSKTKEPGSGFQDLGDRFLLIGNGCDHQISDAFGDLFSIRRPGIRNNSDSALIHFGAHVRAVSGAGDQAIQFANRGQYRSGARLQRNHAPGSVVGWHSDHVTCSDGILPAIRL